MPLVLASSETRLGGVGGGTAVADVVGTGHAPEPVRILGVWPAPPALVPDMPLDLRECPRRERGLDCVLDNIRESERDLRRKNDSFFSSPFSSRGGRRDAGTSA